MYLFDCCYLSLNADVICLLSCLLIHFLPAIINLAPDGIFHFLIRKQNEVYYFVVEEHYEEYHSLVDKCLM